MRTFTRVLCTVLTFGLLGGNALAQNVTVGSQMPEDGSASQLPYEALGTFISQPGEDMTQFLIRVSPELRAFSNKTGYEACGVVAVDASGKQFGIVLGSTMSHLGCAAYASKVPAGMTASGKTLHDHAGGSFRMSRADKILTGMDSVDHPVWINGEDIYHFSSTDFQGGPGYLATPDGLVYQDGPGTARMVSEKPVVAANP